MTGRPQPGRGVSRTIALTTIGSAGVAISITPAAIPEAQGGVTIWVRHWRNERSYTLTETEAKQLVAAIADVITPGLFRLEEPPPA